MRKRSFFGLSKPSFHYELATGPVADPVVIPVPETVTLYIKQELKRTSSNLKVGAPVKTGQRLVLNEGDDIAAAAYRTNETLPVALFAYNLSTDGLDSGSGRVFVSHGANDPVLNPVDIIITDEGAVKVTDFGLAKQINVDPELTAAGMVVGTPDYIAPEQANPHDSLGEAFLYTGRYEEAIEEFKAALEIDPAFLWSARNLSEALSITGIRELQRERLARIQELEAVHPRHQQVGYHQQRAVLAEGLQPLHAIARRHDLELEVFGHLSPPPSSSRRDVTPSCRCSLLVCLHS